MQHQSSPLKVLLLALLAGLMFSSIANAQDTATPLVSMEVPPQGATITGSVTIGANASDNVGVARVRFYAQAQLQTGNQPWVLIGEDTLAPFSIMRDTSSIPSGRVYALGARAFDAAGNFSDSGLVYVTVDHLDGTRPTVTITAPAAESTISGVARIAASATDDQGISNVTFYTRGNHSLQGIRSVQSAPYEFMASTLGVPDGRHELHAEATDISGIKSARVGPHWVIVDNSVAPGRLRVDDTNSSTVYTGSWQTRNDDTGTQGRVFHWNSAKLSGVLGANVRFTFTGTGVRWLGTACWECGSADISIDGGPRTNVVVQGVQELGGANHDISTVLYTSPVLPYGTHTIDIAVGPQVSPGHGPYIVVDAFEVLNP